MEKYILVLDAGTTNIKALLFNREGQIYGQARKKIGYIIEEPGQAEQDPALIWDYSRAVINELLSEKQLSAADISSLGITTQRASFLFWNKRTGETYSHIITWQDKRAAGYAARVTGLWWLKIARLITRLITTFIKAGKLILISILKFDSIHTSVRTGYYLRHHKELQERIRKGDREVIWGTVDSWLVWNLTGGKLHVTDYSSASSTGLLDPFSRVWNSTVLKLFGIPARILPEVRETGGDFGSTSFFGGGTIPINAVFADQQASLFGQCCFRQGDLKCTNGTGTFVDLNTGTRPRASQRRLYPLIAWKYRNRTFYMLEGQSQNAGNIIDWIINELHLAAEPGETAALAASVDSTEGLWFLPAFTTGLTFPYWDATTRGNFFGLSLRTRRAHIVRAVLEGICFRIKDLVDGIIRDTGIAATAIKVDGGVSDNPFLLQFLADILGMTVEHYDKPETTALGTAFMAGLACGYWDSREQLASLQQLKHSYMPASDEKTRKEMYRHWQDIIRRSLKFLE